MDPLITLDTRRWPAHYIAWLEADAQRRLAEALASCPIDPADLRALIHADKAAAARRLSVLTPHQLANQALHYAAHLNEIYGFTQPYDVQSEIVLANFQIAVRGLLQLDGALGATDPVEEPEEPMYTPWDRDPNDPTPTPLEVYGPEPDYDPSRDDDDDPDLRVAAFGPEEPPAEPQGPEEDTNYGGWRASAALIARAVGA
jgi:hypothetical protein